MALQNWRWWQWLAASIVVGLGVGLALTRLDPDDVSLPSTPFTLMRAKIERRTEAGESILTRIRVGPITEDNVGRKMQPVTYWERQRNRVTGQWDPTQQFRTATPVPLSAASPRPDFGVMDYLADRKKDIPTLDYRFEWWLVPRNIWLMSLGGSVLLVGVLWPLALKAMIKLGLAEAPTARAASLAATRDDGLSTDSRGPGVTADDRQKLDDLNAELAANVAGMAIGGAAAAKPDAPAAVPVRLGSERPAEPVIGNGPADEKPADFKGEFYPVARPTKHE